MKKQILFLVLVLTAFSTFAADTTSLVIPKLSNKEIFLNYIFGGATWIEYVAASIFVLFGLIVKWYIQINKAVKNNANTPDTFSWLYFFKNNLFKKLFSIFANIIIAFLALRFSSEIFNIPLSMAFATGIGICFDLVIDRVSKWQGGIKIPTP